MSPIDDRLHPYYLHHSDNHDFVLVSQPFIGSISTLLNSVSNETMFSESAFDIWNDFKDRFQQSNGPCVFQIRRQITNLAQNQDPVGVYFTKLKSLSKELSNYRPHCSCGKCGSEGLKKIDEYFKTEHVMNFLMGLNDLFSQTRGQILLIDPLLAINRVFSLVAQEEKQKLISNYTQNDNSMAFLAKSK
uniref:Retrotransposon gag domain-containing protein n=1 Tax=Lactuca sativa TaxID=4236 RepID=A0A9R1XEA2_LACSA|nr:hypothetical protein LSAT_V11C500246220 [Lactuca sativa]